ncbi:hypothetical protein BWQ96_09880 [Gracilariopsis chorda]|uniref:Uncharacterized protein n=1 Tax=Gracilariopsis chorda TaxID=448386 RepID=A0A2V3IGZ9_9FLOR|nr:hypothetical protein BWQ96_09880 [Gracilariopsis chorda]|eukprot:PXF40420.1 hypothetical protein BWQ96_09880 [Gracilariopsis chorda]
MDFKPVRMFLTASSRRSIINNYSDKYWNLSGQKASFYRFKDLAEFVSEYGPVNLRIGKEGKDKDWEYGISNVKKLKLFTKDSVSRSALLRFIRDELKLV